MGKNIRHITCSPKCSLLFLAALNRHNSTDFKQKQYQALTTIEVKTGTKTPLLHYVYILSCYFRIMWKVKILLHSVSVLPRTNCLHHKEKNLCYRHNALADSECAMMVECKKILYNLWLGNILCMSKLHIGTGS